jgi:hypothetical protein
MLSEDTIDSSITSHLNQLLNSRDYSKTICPSEVARALSQPELASAGFSSWRDAMSRIKEVAWERDDIEVLQHGSIVFKDTEIKGPIRLRLRKEA